MYCSKCGTENDDNSSFCNKCGTGLNEATKEESRNFNNFTTVLKRFNGATTCTLTNDSLFVITTYPFRKKKQAVPINNIVSTNFENVSYFTLMMANTSATEAIISFIIFLIVGWLLIWILVPMFILYAIMRTNMLLIETINGKIVLNGNKKPLESLFNEIEKRRA